MFECSALIHFECEKQSNKLNCNQFVSLHMMLFMLFYTTIIHVYRFSEVNSPVTGGKGGSWKTLRAKVAKR